MKAKLSVIYCVGETLEERESKKMQTVLKTQLDSALSFIGTSLVIAYEPVWAIGTGKIPRREDILEMHQHILTLLPKGSVVLYGGSVKAENAAEILKIAGVGGLLVGGASLDATAFGTILRAAS